MSRGRSYAVLAGQLLLVIGIAVLVSVGVQALGGPAPVVGALAAPVAIGLVALFVAERRLAGVGPDPALAGCQVVIALDRWPVGGIWQNKYRASTRAGWAPGVLGLAPGRAVFAPSRAQEADRAWEDVPRAVQVRRAVGGHAAAVRVHGARHGTIQLVAQRHWKDVRSMVEQVLPVTDGWDESLPGPPPEQPVPGRPWPQQYSVRLLLEDGSETRVEVGTWHDEQAAERIARLVRAHRAPAGPAVREAVVVDMGPVPRRPDGLPDISELAVDRQEF